MSGLGDRFVEGDRISQVRHIAHGIDKRREGVVLKVGKQGVQIRFDGGEELWQPAHGLELVEASKKRPRRLSAVGEVPSIIDVSAVDDPAPAGTGNEVLARLEAAGVDLVALWREIGAGLTARRRRAAVEAEEAVAQAEAEVRTAEDMLAEARRRLAGAKAHAEFTRAEVVKVERETGVAR